MKKEFKICRSCDLEKSIECFYKDSYSIDGHTTACKECKKEQRLTEEEKEGEPTKRCIGFCNSLKPHSHFKKDSNQPDGRSLRCKHCLKTKKEKICGIYKITSPTGKIYIGQSEDIKSRFRNYKTTSSDGQPRLHRSLKKYGWFHHVFEIIEECSTDELLCRERHWQDFYNVLGEKGLNCKLTECGDKKQIWVKESKEKLSNTLKVVRQKSPVNLKPVIYTPTQKVYSCAREVYDTGDIKVSMQSFIKKLRNHLINDTYYMYLENYRKHGAHTPVKPRYIKDLIIDTKTLIEYKTVNAAAVSIGVKGDSLVKYLSGSSWNPTYLVYKRNYTGEIHEPEKRIFPQGKKVTNEIENVVYMSMAVAITYLPIGKTLTGKILKGEKASELVSIRYYDEEIDKDKPIIYWAKDE